jgi:hypothetical protein
MRKGTMMNNTQEVPVSRKRIGIRLLYTVLYLIIFEVLKTILQITVLFQFLFLLIAQRYSNPLRTFSNKMATYAYKIMRYLTLNDNSLPFPFTDFPPEVEPPVEQVQF